MHKPSQPKTALLVNIHMHRTKVDVHIGTWGCGRRKGGGHEGGGGKKKGGEDERYVGMVDMIADVCLSVLPIKSLQIPLE